MQQGDGYADQKEGCGYGGEVHRYGVQPVQGVGLHTIGGSGNLLVSGAATGPNGQ